MPGVSLEVMDKNEGIRSQVENAYMCSTANYIGRHTEGLSTARALEMHVKINQIESGEEADQFDLDDDEHDGYDESDQEYVDYYRKPPSPPPPLESPSPAAIVPLHRQAANFLPDAFLPLLSWAFFGAQRPQRSPVKLADLAGTEADDPGIVLTSEVRLFAYGDKEPAQVFSSFVAGLDAGEVYNNSLVASLAGPVEILYRDDVDDVV